MSDPVRFGYNGCGYIAQHVRRPDFTALAAVLQGIMRDQMMARHQANHIQVVYASDREGAWHDLYAKAAAMAELGLEVSLCENV